MAKGEPVPNKVGSSSRGNMAGYAHDMPGPPTDCMDTAPAIACDEVKGGADGK